jgi:hypothetical protein
VTGDLQTIRDAVSGASIPLPAGERRWLTLPDGDALAIAWHPGHPDKPAVVVIHGLTGWEDGTHIRRAAALFIRLGHPVMRLNLRGTRVSVARSRGSYYVGRTADLRDALIAMRRDLGEWRVFLFGVSLGGGLVLNFLGSEDGRVRGLPPILAAATICAPLDLTATTARLEETRNSIYADVVLRAMKQEARAQHGDMTPALRAAVERAGSISQFDDWVTAPRNGFAGIADFYARCRPDARLPAIRVPTLALTAADDPWVPLATYQAVDWSRAPAVTPHVAEGGGHVGFHEAGKTDADGSFADRAAASFFFRYG